MMDTKKLKVMTIVGTRPEIIKLSRVIGELEKHSEHVLVHSGQNYDYELNEIFFRELELVKPKYVLGVGGKSLAETLAQIIARSDEVIEKEAPDAVLLYGDTNTCLSVIPAKRRKIPVFHMEAGNRCFDQRVPEELNRKLVDHLSDINLPLTEHARRYLLAEGLSADTVIKTGSPMREVLEHYGPAIEASTALKELQLVPQRFFVVSVHREENVDREDRLRDILETLRAVSQQYGFPIIVSTHPRTRQRLEHLAEERDRLLAENVRFLKPFGFLDYVKLEMSAYCVLSDSGTITEESSLLGFPAVTLREAHERPEGMDAGVLIMSGLKSERVLQAIAVVTHESADRREHRSRVDDYQDRDVSRKVVRIIYSYVDYVNRTVWKRQ